MEKLTEVSKNASIINDRYAQYQDLKGRPGIISLLNYRFDRQRRGLKYDRTEKIK
ncbi:MAG: hypothetical protein RL732_445 [Bacteroidota bacterium]|jgi:hypothetical protein